MNEENDKFHWDTWRQRTAVLTIYSVAAPLVTALIYEEHENLLSELSDRALPVRTPTPEMPHSHNELPNESGSTSNDLFASGANTSSATVLYASSFQGVQGGFPTEDLQTTMRLDYDKLRDGWTITRPTPTYRRLCPPLEKG